MQDCYVAGKRCTVNNARDLMMDSEAKQFIGEDCVIVKRCRGGLIQVALAVNGKKMCTVPQRNITFLE